MARDHDHGHGTVFPAKFPSATGLTAGFVWSAKAMAPDVPLILTLDSHGVPNRWVTWQQACFYHAKNLVAWTLGETAFTALGGLCRETGERSRISSQSIIAIRGKALGVRGVKHVPPLNNRELFRRDHHTCAYCGQPFTFLRLTRDHVNPVSRGGMDSWMNVVTACRQCNGVKRNRTPEEAGLQLVYAPYVPNRAEYLILTNRRILADQMDFLRPHVATHSRILRARESGLSNWFFAGESDQ